MGQESRTYYDGNVQRWVPRDTVLFPAETLLLQRLKGKWSEIRMLDIGIGGGRTTSVFSNIVKAYSGVDYSQEMCNVVRRRFPDMAAAIQCVDARNLSPFSDSSFDLVLFSYNGLDHVEPDERNRVLSEVHRVLRDRGEFLFSTHCLRVLYPRLSREISVRRRLRYLRENPALFLGRRTELTQAVVREGPVRAVYVDPFEQWRQLGALGLVPTDAIDRHGERLDRESGDTERGSEWGRRHWWIHFFCVAKKTK